MARGLAGGAGRERPASSRSTTTGTSAPATSARRRCAVPARRGDGARAARGGPLPARRPGYESLGIGYAALSLRAAPAGADTSEVFAAIGTMAERLARRASARRGRHARTRTLRRARRGRRELRRQVRAVDPLDDRVGAARLCYDGEAWTRVLAAPAAAPAERARAALFLAVDPCRDPALPPAEARLWNDRRLRALESIDFAAAGALPASLGGRVRLRHAEALAWRAFDEARQGDAEAAVARGGGGGARAGARRSRACSPPRISTSTTRPRSASPPRAGRPRRRPRRAAARKTVGLVRRAAQPGETCVRVVSRRRRREGAPARRALHLRRRLAERAPLGAVGRRRDAGGAAAAGLDRAVGPAPRRGRRPGGSRRSTAGDDRSRRRLRRGGRLLARRRPPAGGARGARPPATSPAASRCWPPRRSRSRSRPAAPTSCSPSSAGAPPPGAPARWRCVRPLCRALARRRPRPSG